MARLFSTALTAAAIFSARAAPLFKTLHADSTNSTEPSTAATFNVTQNALDAQVLNLVFSNLTMNSTCIDDQLACVINNVAICQNGAWQAVDQCNDQFQCLAMPELEGNGTTVECVNPNFAQSVFNSAGVSGINATSISNTSAITFPTINNSTFDDCDGEDDDPSTTNSTSAGSPDGEPVTVTVTITAEATATPTFAVSSASTVTVNAQQASSIIQSISADGGVIFFSTILPTPTISSTSATGVQTGAARAGIPPIQLTAVRPSASASP